MIADCGQHVLLCLLDRENVNVVNLVVVAVVTTKPSLQLV
jgi:hypothetical protein